MRRVLIIGSPGSGKSTFARTLANLTGLPLIHLDRLYWRPNWKIPSPTEWKEQLASVLAQDAWIIDGNYTASIPMRLERADTTIVFDFPRQICMGRALRRLLFTFGRVRPDMAPDCPERLDLKFLRYIWTFRAQRRPKLMEMLDGFRGEVVFLRTPSDVEQLGERLRAGNPPSHHPNKMGIRRSGCP